MVKNQNRFVKFYSPGKEKPVLLKVNHQSDAERALKRLGVPSGWYVVYHKYTRKQLADVRIWAAR